MFSFVPNKEQIEYVLLSTIPLHFYELVAEKVVLKKIIRLIKIIYLMIKIAHK
jgi:hypothetical protein